MFEFLRGRSVYLFLGFAFYTLSVDFAVAKVKPKKLEKQRWVEVKTDNFTVLSDQNEKIALKLAQKLEMFRVAFQLFSTRVIPDDARRVKVVSTRRTQTYSVLTAGSKGLKGTAGFFTDTVNGNYAAVKATQLDSKSTNSQTSISILFHEYTHYLAANLSTDNLPYWYSEGFADFMSAIKFPDSSNMDYGLPLQFHLRALNNMAWTPIEKILKTNHVRYKDREARYRMYSQGWLLTHYSLTKSDRQAQLNQYLASLAKGVSVDDAFRDSFQMSYKELDKALKRYARQREYPYSRITFKKPVELEDFAIRNLKPHEVLFELGEFLLNGRNDHVTSEELFTRGLELNPNHANLLAGQANVAMFDDIERAQALISKAKASDSDNAWVSTISGHINLRRMQLVEDDAGRLKLRTAAVRDYNHAINSGGTNVEAISAAASLYMSEGRIEKGKELLNIAYAYAPSNHTLRAQLIAANFYLGKTQEAENLIELVKRNHHSTQAWLDNFEQWVEKVRVESASGSRVD